MYTFMIEGVEVIPFKAAPVFSKVKNNLNVHKVIPNLNQRRHSNDIWHTSNRTKIPTIVTIVRFEHR